MNKQKKFNENDKILENFISIYNKIKRVDDETINFDSVKNIELNLREILINEKIESLRSKKRIMKIKHYLLFLITFCSKHLYDDFLSEFKNDFAWEKKINEKPEFKLFINNLEKNSDIFSVSKKNVNSYDDLLDCLKLESFNKYSSISNYKIKNDKIQLDSKNLKNIYLELFKNIYYLRLLIVHKNQFDENENNFNISTTLISLLIIANFFSNNIFSIINNEYRELFSFNELEKNDILNLNLLQKISNSFIKFNNKFKSNLKCDRYIKYDKKYFDKKIIDLENQFDISEYKEAYVKTGTEDRWKSNQLRNYYIKLFTIISYFNFEIKNLLVEELKILKETRKLKENSNKEKIIFEFNNDLFHQNELFNEKTNFNKKINEIFILLNGAKHKSINISDNFNGKKIFFVEIYKENLLKNLAELNEIFRKTKINNWFDLKDINEYKNLIWFNDIKRDEKEIDQNLIQSYKETHKGIVISSIKRLIENFEFQISSFKNNVFLKEEVIGKKQQKKIKLFNKNDINLKENDINLKYELILSKHKNLDIKIENDIKTFESKILFLKDRNQKNYNKKKFIQDLIKSKNMNYFKFLENNENKIYYIKTVNIDNEFWNKESLLSFLKKNNYINKKNLFKYYSDILKMEIDENSINLDNLTDLISKNIIKLNLKINIYYLNNFIESKWDKNKEFIEKFFNNIIIKKINKEKNFENYEKKIREKYKNLGLVISDKNPILEFFNVYSKNKNNKKVINLFYDNIYENLKKNNYKEIIFFTYVQKNTLNFLNSKMFKKSVLSILNSNLKNTKKIDFVKEILLLKDEYLTLEKGKYIFNKNFDFKKFYSTNNMKEIKKNIKLNNGKGEKKIFLKNVDGISEKYTIKYKIKSGNFELNDSIKLENFSKENKKQSQNLIIKLSEIEKIIQIFINDQKLLLKHNILYNELLQIYKNNLKSMRPMEILFFKNIKTIGSSYSVSIFYDEQQYKYTKIKKSLSNANYSKIDVNNFENKIYFTIKVPKAIQEIMLNFQKDPIKHKNVFLKSENEKIIKSNNIYEI